MGDPTKPWTRPVVHLSDAMCPEWTACGLVVAPDIKRTQDVVSVTCGVCKAIHNSAMEAANG